MKQTKKLLLAALLMLSPLVANAIPITWTISNSTNGNHNGGMFDYDADTGIYAPVDISGCCIDDYDLNNGATVDLANSNASQLSLDGYIYPDSLLLEFAAPLTNAGGVLSVNWFEKLNYLDVSNTDYNYSGTMTITSASVPEPTTLALLGLGIAGIGFSRKRKA